MIRKNATGEQYHMRPYEALVFDELIVRSVEDTSYPEISRSTGGISPWFKVEVWGFYDYGLLVTLGCHSILEYEDRSWEVVQHVPDPLPPGSRKGTAFLLGRIPFRNIGGFDPVPNDAQWLPVLWCLFADGGAPYEGFEWVDTTRGKHREFEPERRRSPPGGSLSPL
jgi:hypothetical protein